MDEVFNRARKRFDAAVSTQWPERALCLSDRRFSTIDGAQWEGDGWDEMSENMVRVQVDKVRKGLKRITNDYRANRVTVNYREITGKAAGCADLLDGLFRADVALTKGDLAFDNCFIEGATGGMGAVHLCNDYVDEYDPDNDYQRVHFDTITDADNRVIFGPSALQDKSDAEWAILLIPNSAAEYREKYPQASDWAQIPRNRVFDWYAPDLIWTAWYFEVEMITEKRTTFTNIVTGDEQSYWASALTDDARSEMEATGWRAGVPRNRKRRRVAKYVLSGNEVLEDRKLIAGDQIPLVPYYGQWAVIDNIERIQGYVRPLKDPQRIYNTQISKMVEQAALAPREVPMVTPEQILGHENRWAEMNLKRHPYALLNPMTDGSGQIIATGPIGKIEPPMVSPVQAALLQIASADIDAMPGGGEASTQTKSNVSAEAMDIAATRMDGENAEYIDNFRIFMQRVGEVYMGIAAEIYVEAGREVDVHDPEGGHSTEQLFKAAVNDLGIVVTHNDLSAARFNVIASVSEATATRRDKTVKSLINIAEMAGQQDPELSSVCLSTAVENMDGEGMDALKKWNRKRLIKLGIVEPNDEERAEQAKADAQEQQPSAQDTALQAQAEKDSAIAQKHLTGAQLDMAKVGLTQSQQHLVDVEAAVLPADVAAKHHVQELGHMRGMHDSSVKKVGLVAGMLQRMRGK